MEKCEFEEKEYEIPLNHQLLSGNHIIWPPGQVFEGHFGIDAAMYAFSNSFWSKFGLSKPLIGVVLQDYNWGYIWKKTKMKKRLPDFNLNLFVQSKRPEYLYGRNSSYAIHGIKGPYYRFETMSHQQKALEKLSEKLGNKALVVYACPAFHTNLELFRRIREQNLVDNSSFVRVIKMKGHSKWIFDDAGTKGLACSEIERIEDPPLLEQVKQIIGDNEPIASSNDSEAYLEGLLKLEKAIIEGFTELREDNSYAEEFFKRDQDLIENGLVEVESVRAFTRVLIASNLLNLRWNVIGSKSL